MLSSVVFSFVGGKAPTEHKMLITNTSPFEWISDIWNDLSHHVTQHQTTFPNLSLQMQGTWQTLADQGLIWCGDKGQLSRSHREVESPPTLFFVISRKKKLISFRLLDSVCLYVLCARTFELLLTSKMLQGHQRHQHWVLTCYLITTVSFIQRNISP